MPNGIEAKDVKFIGIVNSYNEAKKFGMVACDEAHFLWGQEIYAFKDVLAAADAGVGDTIRFGVHVNPRGQPQVSLPVWKVGEDGLPIGVPEGTKPINAEECAADDPSFLENLKEEIEGRSQQQNQKRTRISNENVNGWPGADGKGGKGGGSPPQPAKRMRQNASSDDGWGRPGPSANSWGGGGEAFHWGGGPPGAGKGWGGSGGAWGPPEVGVTLFVSGLPAGVQRREVLHIFRQYAGFSELRLVGREDHCIAFASFATMAQAQFVADALNGYVFDEEAPHEYQTQLSLTPAKEKMRSR